MPVLTPDSIMPFGPFQGKKMSEVPAQYLLWLREIHSYSLPPAIRDYIREYLPILTKSEKYKIGDEVVVSLYSKPFSLFRNGFVVDIWKHNEKKSLYKVKYKLLPGEISETTSNWLDIDVIKKLIINPSKL